MKERGMIFNAEMVWALLGDRKTQTRRPIKMKAPIQATESGRPLFYTKNGRRTYPKCPFGQVGDRIWVRETFRLFDHSDECGASDHCSCPPTGTLVYRADFDDTESKWTPSIHMPRWASRITLEIIEVRIERVQDLSRGDCMSEGCPFPNIAKETSPIKWYSELWQSLYGNWDQNPWVYVIEFKKVEA